METEHRLAQGHNGVQATPYSEVHAIKGQGGPRYQALSRKLGVGASIARKAE